jgi:hypothetical protein
MRRSNGELAPCDRCGGPEGRIVRYILASGAIQLRWRCSSCSRIQLGSLPHAGHDLESYPIAKDNRGSTPPCARCGTIGNEFHHWAPSALFEDSWEWPTAYLCQDCHRRWRQVTRTNGSPEGGRVAPDPDSLARSLDRMRRKP